MQLDMARGVRMDGNTHSAGGLAVEVLRGDEANAGGGEENDALHDCLVGWP